jgi:hypothetical protein
MVRRDVVQLAMLLVIPAICALVGFLIGRLNRGGPTEIERKRPRIAISVARLRDGRNEALSLHTRIRCAFEAVYVCCCEVADTQGLGVVGKVHPSDEVLRAGLTAMNASTEDCEAIKLLADWIIDASPSLPSLTVKDACKLAERLHAKTVSMLL